MALPKYSFGWFKALLEMEHLNSGKTSSDSRKVSISFAKVEPEPDTQRTLILKHPSQYIPQSMEDLADIPLVLHMGDGKKTVAIEVANVMSYTLREKYDALNYDDTFNMQENLCENIEFVFGPPGTGKTTYPARNVLLPLMRAREN